MQKTQKEIAGLSIFVIFLLCCLIMIEEGNIEGHASYEPIRVEGRIVPKLPDGSLISFKINDIEIASAEIKGGYYEISLKRDDPITANKDGYIKGDKVDVYIEDIKIATLSYFEQNTNIKNFQVSISQRIEINERFVKRTALE